METIKLIRQVDNRSIGIFRHHDGTIVVMTLGTSKTFKTVKGAAKWLAARGYE